MIRSGVGVDAFIKPFLAIHRKGRLHLLLIIIKLGRGLNLIVKSLLFRQKAIFGQTGLETGILHSVVVVPGVGHRGLLKNDRFLVLLEGHGFPAVEPLLLHRVHVSLLVLFLNQVIMLQIFLMLDQNILFRFFLLFNRFRDHKTLYTFFYLRETGVVLPGAQTAGLF